MNKQIILFILFSFFYFQSIQTQSVSPGYAFNKAVAKGSRSLNGKPGLRYWQNKADYDIYVKVNPANKHVEAYETIEYTNNSPDTLYSIRYKFYLNTHAPATERHYPISDEYLSGGIIVDKFLVNDKVIKWKEDRDKTDYHISLPNALYPHQTVKINFSWHYSLAWQHLREGMIDSTSAFIAYFYPRIAVYDDYRYWDDVPFTEDREFYNDFNNYKLTVQVPKNYLVWSTGELLNVDEILQSKFRDRYKSASSADQIINIVNRQEREHELITLDREWLMWRFAAENVSDVAFAVSNNYIWDATSIKLKGKEKRILVQSAYNSESQDFKEMAKFAKEGILWFSDNIPGVPYPFSNMTVVRGYADMEYPMMVNDNSQSSSVRTRWIAEHEIAHSWFPFYMGINEAVYPFMDEGWAVFMEYWRNRSTMGETDADRFFIQTRSWRWSKGLNVDEIVPVITPAHILNGHIQGSNAYVKPALAYIALYQLLGEKNFLKCLQQFMNDWHSKHPSPWDMFYSFDNTSEKNLGWFWKIWFYENSYVDLSIKSASKSGKKIKLNISNPGKCAIPFEVVIYSSDNKIIRQSFNPGIWEENPNELSLKIPCGFTPAAIEIQTGIFVDKFDGDNVLIF